MGEELFPQGSPDASREKIKENITQEFFSHIGDNTNDRMDWLDYLEKECKTTDFSIDIDLTDTTVRSAMDKNAWMLLYGLYYGNKVKHIQITILRDNVLEYLKNLDIDSNFRGASGGSVTLVDENGRQIDGGV